MTPTEHPAKMPSAKTGLSAALRGLFRGRGIGAPSALRQRRRLALATLCAAAATLALATDAPAAVTHAYLSQITEVPAVGPASEPVPLPGPLTHVNAMTVDSGKLYLAERHGSADAYRLDSFDAGSGAFLSQFAQIPQLAYLYQGISVRHSSGEIYWAGDEFAPSAEGAVAVLSAAGSLESIWKGADTPSGKFGCFECNGSGDVATDNSTSSGDWAAGDVYVADPLDAVVDVFEPQAGGGEKYVTRLEGSEPGVPFGKPTAVAIDQSSGEVLVVDEGVVDVFEPTVPGEYALLRQLTETPAGPLGATGVAVDGTTGDVYVAAGALVEEFDAAGNYLGRLTATTAGPFSAVESVAVDPITGRVYVGDYNQGQNSGAVDIFGPNLVIPDVTVTEPVSSLRPESAVLHGTVNPAAAGEASCEFELGTTTAYGRGVPCTGPVGEGSVPVAVESVTAGGLSPDTTYHYRLDATNLANGQTNTGQCPQDCGEFTTPGPGIHSESASNVNATSATLEASIDPHGAPTSYYFQYGTDSAYEAAVPAPPGEAIGAGAGEVEVARHIQGLSSATTYHYRVVAVSEWAPGEVEEFPGEDQTFTTQPASTSTGLPDNRGWELVTPPNKHGSPVLPLSYEGALIQAAAEGGAITYASNGPLTTDPAGNRSIVNSQNISHRTAQGWRTEDITAPNEEPSGLHIGLSEYKVFSNDVTVGGVEPPGETLLSPQATAPTVYLHQSDGSFLPLVNAANVLPGSVFFETETGPISGRWTRRVELVSATPDLNSVVLSDCAKLTAEATEACEPGVISRAGPEVGNLYVWKEGALTLASIPPQGESFGAEAEPQLGDFNRNVRHAISDDGNRITFRAERESGGKGLFLRDLARGETVRLDEPQPGAPDQFSREPTFQEASSDGSRIFFTDPAAITADSTAGQGPTSGADLYMCVIRESGGHLRCDLSDLTVAGTPSVTAGFGGNVIGTSTNGDRAYFAAGGALTTSPNPRGEHAVENSGANACRTLAETNEPQYRCNLYVSDTETNTVKLVAVLSGEDVPTWSKGSGTSDLGYLTARVSPNGKYLAFMSDRSLTGYDNRDAVSGQLDEEVFLYDAQTETLSCVSCNATGARPHGFLNDVPSPGALVDFGVWGNHWLAGSIPGWDHINNNQARHQPRYLSDSGRMFFNANDSLAPQDSNGTSDVYEFEPPGVGDCTVQSSTFNPVSDGCVALISAGTSGEESAFLDASESGDDAFFITKSRLTPADVDGALDIYDARVGGGEPEIVKPVECSGDACQQPAVPPSEPTISTSVPSGPGNLLQCPKGKVKQKGKCVARKHHKAKHKKKGKKAKRIASHNRGGAK